MEEKETDATSHDGRREEKEEEADVLAALARSHSPATTSIQREEGRAVTTTADQEVPITTDDLPRGGEEGSSPAIHSYSRAPTEVSLLSRMPTRVSRPVRQAALRSRTHLRELIAQDMV